MNASKELWFTSGGQRCAGLRYLPSESSRELPCVVMAHGTTGTVDFGLTRYARRFAEAGFAVVGFDYRHFGRSEGRPRQLIRVSEQLADWRAAVGYAKEPPGGRRRAGGVVGDVVVGGARGDRGR